LSTNEERKKKKKEIFGGWGGFLGESWWWKCRIGVIYEKSEEYNHVKKTENQKIKNPTLEKKRKE